jgi:hypothetical protein
MIADKVVAARERYRRDGFYVCPEPVVPGETVRQAVAGMDAVRAGEYDTGRPPRPSSWSPGDDPNALCKIEMPQIASHAIMQLVSHPALGAKAAAISAARAVQVWWVQLLYKPPAASGGQRGTNVGWHQDYNYWRSSDRPQMLTAWIPLQEVNPELGTMHFVKGSNKWGWHEEYSHFGRYDMAEQERVIRQHMPEEAEYQTAPVLLEAGRVSFHHCLTLHGSGPNHAHRQHRRAIAIHIQADACRWRKTGAQADNHKCSQEMQRLAKSYGDKFEGAYWPQLFSL